MEFELLYRLIIEKH